MESSHAVTVLGGKYKNPFLTSALNWDPDVNLEGMTFAVKEGSDKVKFFGNITQFFVEELDLKQISNADPVMTGFQGGIDAKAALTYYRSQLN